MMIHFDLRIRKAEITRSMLLLVSKMALKSQSLPIVLLVNEKKNEKKKILYIYIYFNYLGL